MNDKNESMLEYPKNEFGLEVPPDLSNESDIGLPSLRECQDSGKVTSQSKELLELNLKLQQDIDEDRKAKYVRTKKIDVEYEKYKEADRKTALLGELNFTEVPSGSVEKLIRQNREVFSSYRGAKAFIGPMFNGIVPFTRGEAILVCAETGGSKTSTAASIMWSTVKQKDPKTGEFGRVLVISNEERENDYFNRVACLAKLEDPSQTSPEDWYYVNRGRFKQEQIDYFSDFITKFKGTGLLNVIALDHVERAGELAFTYYIENIIAILDQVVQSPGKYSCVLIDYYQNIRSSLKRPLDSEWQVQAAFAASINAFKDKIDCPIVIMAQIDPDTDVKSWKKRIVGTKAIAQPCSFVMEAISNKDSFTTDWIFHKARYADSAIRKLTTGFKYGLIVAKDEEFDKWVAPKLVAKREHADKRRESELEKDLGSAAPKKGKRTPT